MTTAERTEIANASSWLLQHWTQDPDAMTEAACLDLLRSTRAMFSLLRLPAGEWTDRAAVIARHCGEALEGSATAVEGMGDLLAAWMQHAILEVLIPPVPGGAHA